MKADYRQFFSFNQIELFLKIGKAIDGTKGGLLLGPYHSSNGIPVLLKYTDGYRCMAEFEGQEYLLNPGATQHYENKLHSINQYDRDKAQGHKAPLKIPNITTIDCFINKNESKFLLLNATSGQFVINKYSTWKYLSQLNEMNDSVGWRFNNTTLDYVEDEIALKYSDPILEDYFFEKKQINKVEKTTIFSRIINSLNKKD